MLPITCNQCEPLSFSLDNSDFPQIMEKTDTKTQTTNSEIEKSPIKSTKSVWIDNQTVSVVSGEHTIQPVVTQKHTNSDNISPRKNKILIVKKKKFVNMCSNKETSTSDLLLNENTANVESMSKDDIIADLENKLEYHRNRSSSLVPTKKTPTNSATIDLLLLKSHIDYHARAYF